MENKVYSVSQLNRYIKLIFDKDTFLNNVSIRGEITNFKAHYTGHLYFTLKDESASIKCVMFKTSAMSIKFKPQDGMKVVISGQVNVFERDGAYQIYCKTMSPEGLGELYLAYEQLKEKLKKEGLFEPELKKQIPFLPKRVGIITSKTGAVVKDIINVTTRRYDKVDLLIYPAAVQGVNVSATVIAGLEYFNTTNNVDIIIIARGGGSFEDLFGFNDEGIARKIYESNIPVISAVGHETDFTICDFVSDLRAPTPSAAAELVYPRYIDILGRITRAKDRLVNGVQNYTVRKRDHINRIRASKFERGPLDEISKYRMVIDSMIKTNQRNVEFKIERFSATCMKLISKIDTLSPLKTLIRGYSLAHNTQNGKLVSSIDDVSKADVLDITLKDGRVNVVVEGVCKK